MIDLTKLNETHHPQARSWVNSANDPGTPFPIQNLPFGVFKPGTDSPRIGVAIGDFILDLHQAADTDLLGNISGAVQTSCRSRNLNDLMALSPAHWSALRKSLFHLLHSSAPTGLQEKAKASLVSRARVEMSLPCQIGDYTDFYAGIFHASNVGSLFRPQNPLLPNYKWIPIAYHGRSSSIIVSGTPVLRPSGQIKSLDAAAPAFAPCRQLDFELELGIFIGPGNALGQPIPVEQAEENIFGVCLLNDWSARDIQTWEYQPLGPFLAKNFATTISPWIVTLEALAPFRAPAFARPAGDPGPLPYLDSQGAKITSQDVQQTGIDIALEVFLSTERMRKEHAAPNTISQSSSRDLYWTIAQLVAHHTSNGCNLRPGDLLGTGTISGSTSQSLGSLLEMTRQGANPIELPNRERRAYLEQGDEVIFQGWCRREGYASIGFGECRGRIEDQRR
jgi:fumarylacetoacetase